MKLQYAMFTTSADFEKWQDENPNVKINQVQPMISGLRMRQPKADQMDAAATPVNIFVLYHTDPYAAVVAANKKEKK